MAAVREGASDRSRKTSRSQRKSSRDDGDTSTQIEVKGETTDEFLKRIANTSKEMQIANHDQIITQGGKVSFDVWQANMDKNRYSNTPLLDKTRVKLRETSIAGESDYINASLVSTNDGRYILTQGPTSVTTVAFWRMVWQERTRLIVCLAPKVGEDVNNECFQYWPTQGERSEQDGRFVISVHRKTGGASFDRYELKLSRSEGDSKKKEKEKETRDVQLVHFKVWSLQEWPLAEVIELVETVTTMEETLIAAAPNDFLPPVIVHGSSGCRRTGTFVALVVIARKMRSREGFNPDRIARVIRQQRFNVMATKAQYLFMYAVCFEMSAKDHLVPKQAAKDFYIAAHNYSFKKR